MCYCVMSPALQSHLSPVNNQGSLLMKTDCTSFTIIVSRRESPKSSDVIILFIGHNSQFHNLDNHEYFAIFANVVLLAGCSYLIGDGGFYYCIHVFIKFTVAFSY